MKRELEIEIAIWSPTRLFWRFRCLRLITLPDLSMTSTNSCSDSCERLSDASESVCRPTSGTKAINLSTVALVTPVFSRLHRLSMMPAYLSEARMGC